MVSENQAATLFLQKLRRWRHRSVSVKSWHNFEIKSISLWVVRVDSKTNWWNFFSSSSLSLDQNKLSVSTKRWPVANFHQSGRRRRKREFSLFVMLDLNMCGKLLLNIGTGLCFWSEKSRTVTNQFQSAILKLMYVHNRLRIITRLKMKKQIVLSWNSNPPSCVLRFDASSSSSGLVLSASSALVQWLSGRTCAWAPSGCSFQVWSDPDPTQCFVSIQTAASHSLDYSTVLPMSTLLWGTMQFIIYELLLCKDSRNLKT